MEHRFMERKLPHVSSGLFNLSERKSFALEFRSTVLLCIGILFFTLMVFCGLDPGNLLEEQNAGFPRNGPTELPSSFPFRSRVLHSSSVASPTPKIGSISMIDNSERALQGMGKMFRKASKSMVELIVAHLAEGVNASDFRLFMRALHRSGATARADVVLLYDSLSPEMLSVLDDEEISFQRLLSEIVISEKSRPSVLDSAISAVNTSMGPFNPGAFWKSGRSQKEDANSTEEQGFQLGSVIGFDLQELDSENALKGFLDKPSVQLRRWLCYQMLLGMVKQKYRHVLLTEVQGVLLLGDSLAAVRNRKQSLYLSAEDRSWSDVEQTAEKKNETENKMERRIVRRRLTAADEDIGMFTSEDDEDDDLVKEALNSGIEQKESVPNVVNYNSNVKQPESSPSDSVKPTGRKTPTQSSKKKGSIKNNSIRRVPSVDGKKATGRGLIESVYGRQLWNSLDKEDQKRSVVNSGVILGDIRLVRILTNRMVTEIVRVALERKSRNPFHDKAILNYLVCKSSVLGKRTLDHLRMVDNRDSVVHSLRGSKQPNAFFGRKGHRFAVLHGYRKSDTIATDVHSAICSSPFSEVYTDCSPFSQLQDSFGKSSK